MVNERPYLKTNKVDSSWGMAPELVLWSPHSSAHPKAIFSPVSNAGKETVWIPVRRDTCSCRFLKLCIGSLPLMDCLQCSDADSASCLLLWQCQGGQVQGQGGMLQRVGSPQPPAIMSLPGTVFPLCFSESHSRAFLGFSMYCMFSEMTRIYFTQATQYWTYWKVWRRPGQQL